MTNWFQIAHVNPIYGWGPSRRYIIQGGPDTDIHLEKHLEAARKAGCVYAEIRCFDDYSAYRTEWEKAGWVYQPHYDVTIDPAAPIPDAKMRQIRKALGEGFSWEEVSDKGVHGAPCTMHDDKLAVREIRKWYRLLRRFYWFRLHRPLPRYRFFEDLILHKGCKLLVVKRGNGVVGSGVVGSGVVGGVLLAVEADGSKAYEWYICGQVMSTWAAIEWCRNHGIRCFDTMGAGRPGVPYGVRDFKLQMGGTLHEYGRYIYILRPCLYRIGTWIMH